MEILNNVSLYEYSTMGLGGKAKHLTKISSTSELKMALKWANENSLESMIIGSGSNIVWSDNGFSGLVIVNSITGFEVIEDNEHSCTIKIGGGENWDEVVKRTVDMNLSGIECLSLIPGTAGATPVQNVGAYGQEISYVLVNVEVLDKNLEYDNLTLFNEDLDFSYRSSIFKQNPGRYYISSITLKLNKTVLKPPFYASLQLYLLQNKISDYSPVIIRRAVIAIRSYKLPDPKLVKNCGSFFKNPTIDISQLESLEKKLDIQIPHWPDHQDAKKISAAWLIENVGFSNFHDQETGMATWKNQPLVIVNETAKSTGDLIKFRDSIVNAVEQKFHIKLEQEPLLI